jgi:hypothetical protein
MDGDRRPVPRGDMRVGDADRQEVVAELQRHFVDGRLTSEELGERVAQALGARTFSELAEPLHDLPDLNPAPMTDPGPSRHQYGPPLLSEARVLAVALLVIGLLAMVWLFFGSGMRMGIMPFWPIFIWGFFIFGRSHRGGRGRY